MTLPVVVRPEAEQDIRFARRDLEETQAGLGEQCSEELRELFARIESMPEIYGVVRRHARAARLKRLRYVACYLVFPDRVEVFSVLNSSRNPDVWKSRITAE